MRNVKSIILEGDQLLNNLDRNGQGKVFEVWKSTFHGNDRFLFADVSVFITIFIWAEIEGDFLLFGRLFTSPKNQADNKYILKILKTQYS